ncbi:MAG: tyrosine recombinase XerC [Ruminococcus sp.]|nr:tyrosine recombinase XerC [Candidatus Apopatosoma intestinale]
MPEEDRWEEKDKSPVVERFLRYKLVIQGRSRKTVEEYGLDLRTFFRYLVAARRGLPTDEESFEKISIACVDDAFVKSVRTLDILEFMAFCAGERGNSAVSRSRKLAAIRSFYKYLVTAEKLVEKNPAADIEAPKTKKTLPKYLSLEESLSLLQSVLDDPESRTKERDYCILTLFLNCGMRLSELCGINLSDLDRELRSLRVVGKGNKERIVYLNDACRVALSAYLKIRLAEPGVKDKNALFLSRLHTRISNKTVQWMAGKYFTAAGLDYKKYSVHKLRHTAATLMYQEGGVDVLTLKEILGHAQLNTTQIYTHASNKLMEDAMEKNPLAHVRQKKTEPKDEE